MQAACGERYAKTAAVKPPAKVAPPASFATAPPAELAAYKAYKEKLAAASRARNAGVLGLGALCGAHPFDVPPFLPSLLSVLAKYVADPPPVGPGAKKLLAEFRRTHEDNWAAHKLAFTSDQLSDLQDVTVGAQSYFL